MFPRMPAPFLTARWSNLILATWALPDALLERFLPPGVELDRWNGSAHASLVAFDFHDTCVRGFRIPGFVNFPEVNLRIYVRHGERRGVVFVRELVPSVIVSTVARIFYNEPYFAADMSSSCIEEDGLIKVEHRVNWQGMPHRILASGSKETRIPSSDSVEHHFKEHSWGFGKSRGGALQTYRVEHPIWAVREVRDFICDVEFDQLYGQEWGVLASQPPMSVIFAEGSEIAVYPLDP